MDPAKTTANRIIGVIPARWNSTRFPGKPLAMIREGGLNLQISFFR